MPKKRNSEKTNKLASKRKPSTVLKFRLRSSRGIDNSEIFELRGKPSEDVIRELCEAWCSKFSEWNYVERLTWGWESVKTKLARPRFTLRHSSNISWATESDDYPAGWYVWDAWNDKNVDDRYIKKRTAQDIADMLNDGLFCAFLG